MILEMNKKRQAVGGCRPLQPYAGAYPPTQQIVCASLIISTFPFCRKGNLWKRGYCEGSCLLYFCGAREIIPCAAFLFISAGSSRERQKNSANLCGCDHAEIIMYADTERIIICMRRHCAAPFLIL